MGWRPCIWVLGTLLQTAFSHGLQCAHNRNPEERLTESNCDSCFTVWETNKEDGSEKVVEQGCWNISALSCIQDDQCIHNPILVVHPRWENMSVCCCQGSMCNENFAISSRPSSPVPPFVVVFVPLLVLFTAFAILLLLWWKKKSSCIRKDPELKLYESKEELLPNSRVVTDICLNNFMADGFIGNGAFAKLMRLKPDPKGEEPSLLMGKKFHSNQRNFYEREKKAYDLLSQLNCTHFLHFYGAYEGSSLTPDGGSLLCLELAPLDLATFLMENTVDWYQLSRILQDISQGVAALHNNVSKGRRLTICHGDLCTSNILLREDLSCCISNFTNATIFQEGCNGSYSQGTTRYLAPEVLGQCLSLTNMENSLKQVDIYGFALVLWEISRRCHDLYPCPVPDFEMAYVKEIGMNPSLQQMKILVGKNRARPLFPEVWKDSNPAIQLLKETIVESWDDDGEARLTASCITERFQDLTLLWTKYKLVSQGPPTVDKSWLNNTQPERRRCNEVASLSFHNQSGGERSIKNANVVSGQRPSLRIQPHQIGSNPCMERNYIANSDRVGAAHLILGSVKDKPMMSAVQQQQPRPQPQVAVSSSSSENRRIRHNHPIPYLHNNISVSSRTKSTNVGKT